jgi:hypothetical protein
LFAKPSKLIEDLMEPLKKHKKVPFDDWAALLGYLTKVQSMLKEVRRLKVFQLFDTVSNIDAITEKMPSDAVRRWMTICQNLPDGQQGMSFEKFVTDEWAYATSVVSRVTSPEQALKTLGVSGGGGGGGNTQNSGTGGAGGKFNNWRDKCANKNGGGGPNQVPVGPAQPNGGGRGQAAQKTADTAAGTANENGNSNQNANHQNVQKGQQIQKNNQRQSYANYGGNNDGGGGGGANDDKEVPGACRVEFCAHKERHFLDRCDVFPTLPMTKRWVFLRENNLCTYCLKHSAKLVCYKAANEKGPFPCGIEGCTEIHHPWLHCYSSVKGHVGLRIVTMRPEEPHMEPPSDKQVERESVAAGASAVNQIVLEPIGSDQRPVQL